MRCPYIGTAYRHQKHIAVQCKHEEGHEGWHQLEVKNTEGTYKKTDVYLRKNDG